MMLRVSARLVASSESTISIDDASSDSSISNDDASSDSSISIHELDEGKWFIARCAIRCKRPHCRQCCSINASTSWCQGWWWMIFKFRVRWWARGAFIFFVIFVGVWSKKAAEAALNRLREKILRVRHISPLCLCACEILPLDEL